MSNRYILVNKKIKQVPLLEWVEWMKKPENKRVAENTVGKYWISTVFLSLDHNFGEGKPLLFETMVFKGNLIDLDMARYSTYEEAEKGHKKMVKKWSKP